MRLKFSPGPSGGVRRAARGAAIEATAGGLRGVRGGRQAQVQQNQQSQANVAAAKMILEILL